MISFDTNLLFKANHAKAPQHEEAEVFLHELTSRDDVAICEYVLVEFYLLLRNPAVMVKPLSSPRAAARCQSFRSHPKWRLIDQAPVMDRVWETAASGKSFARRRIIDLRIAYTLQHHGVEEFATTNLKDFRDTGFARVWNPLA